MKQKLFFLLYSMNVGGVEKSLLGLLTTLPQEKYEIHVGLLQRKGGYLDQLPNYVILHDCCQGCWRVMNDPPLVTVKAYLSHYKILNAIIYLLCYFIYKISTNKQPLYRYMLRHEKTIDVEFDKAFAYAGPSDYLNYYVCKKIKAKKRYGWIHFDVKTLGANTGKTRMLYQNFEKIYIVSEEGKAHFDELYPEYKDKTEVRYNIVSRGQCLSLAKIAPTFIDDYQGKRILTVGRLSEEKGQDVTIDVLKILLDKEFDVRWYYVGDGKLRGECEQKAKDLGIEDKVTFLGTQTNPYGYMRDCDIYVQPSRHEGYCITLAEARCFSAPIVATNFVGAKEQLSTYSQSAITGMSALEIAEGIMKFL